MGNAEIEQRFKTELKFLLEKYNLKFYFAFDYHYPITGAETDVRLGVEKADEFEGEFFFNLDEFIPKELCP